MPTLDETFGDNKQLLNILKRNGVRSVAPIMMLPKKILIETFAGIGQHNATYVTDALAQQNLKQHILGDDLHRFIKQQFGSIEDAPLAVLNVVSLRSLHGVQPFYAPLRLLNFFEEWEPRQTVMDLARLSIDEVLATVRKHHRFGPVHEHMGKDLKDLSHRLSYWDLNLELGTPKLVQLHVVNQ